MKRINIQYGGERYSVGNRDLDELKAEIAAGLRDNAVYWLEVNEGDGVVAPAFLALSAGTSLALSPVLDEGKPAV